MRVVPLLPVLCLAACGGHDGTSGNAVDVGAAANRAQRDIANYAASTPTPTPDALPPATAPAPAPAPSPKPSPIAAAGDPALGTPAAARSDAAAADIVHQYVDALSQRRFHDAWGLWRGHGEASGMSAAAFAASFDKYADIVGEVGTPYDEDAGAGQVYVTVPLTLHGQLKRGGPFVLRGPVVLHRANEGIETDDPTDHLWRIDRTELKSRPGTFPDKR